MYNVLLVSGRQSRKVADASQTCIMVDLKCWMLVAWRASRGKRATACAACMSSWTQLYRCWASRYSDVAWRNRPQSNALHIYHSTI